MDSMTDFMSRSAIQDKIHEVSKIFFDIEIIDVEMLKSIEDEMQKIINELSQEIAKNGELVDMWPMAIGYLLDTVLAQQVVIKFQGVYIKDVKDG